MTLIIRPEIKTFDIRQEGTRVILLLNGQEVASLPPDAALLLARALIIQAKKAEELACAEQIALDSAIMLRAGAPFVLSSRPDILTEAKKEAAWGSGLRRYMPDRGIKSQEKFGTPTIIRHSPRKGVNDA